jgi:hypothetical protein
MPEHSEEKWWMRPVAAAIILIGIPLTFISGCVEGLVSFAKWVRNG